MIWLMSIVCNCVIDVLWCWVVWLNIVSCFGLLDGGNDDEGVDVLEYLFSDVFGLL